MTCKIVHLTSIHAPFDTRIFYKECTTLARAGYDVTLVAPSNRTESVNGVRIRAVPQPSTRYERIKHTVRQVYQAALDEDGDLYHFHDPELLPIGIWLKLRGKKVVYDIHENLPAQILGKTYLRPSILRHTIARGALFSEWIATRVLDGLVIANPRVAERFSSSKVISLANYPILSLIDDSPSRENMQKERPVIIYVGGLTPIRGICEMIDAIELLNDDTELWLLGPWVSEAFKSHCMEKPGWKHAHYLGYVTPEEVYGYLKNADIGMVLLHPQQNYLTNLPVKAFEYMACSLPMIMSDFPYWREVFEGAAIFVDPENPEAITKAIQYLLDHPNEARRIGKTGRQLVEKKYSWEAESQKLLALYKQILGDVLK